MNAWQTFDGFVCDAENRRANELALRFAGGRWSSPAILVLHGNGVPGKTHLLNAICHHHLARGHGSVVAYVSARQFANECLGLSRERPADRVLEYYGCFDCMLVDDVHLLGPDLVARGVFAGVCASLLRRGGRLAFVSSFPVFSQDELGRLAAAFAAEVMAAELGTPAEATRLAILDQATRRRGCRFTAAALRLLARQETMVFRAVLTLALCLGHVAKSSGRTVTRAVVARRLGRLN